MDIDDLLAGRTHQMEASAIPGDSARRLVAGGDLACGRVVGGRFLRAVAIIGDTITEGAGQGR